MPDRCLTPRRLLVLLALPLALGACGGGGKPAAGAAPGGGAAGGAPPPPQVGVVTVQPASVALVTELPGRVEAARSAQVRARVTGIVQKRLFREGSDVKAGQALFQIDPAPYQAALDSAQATLAKANANLSQATALATRFKPLREAKAISEQEYVNAASAQAQAQADVASARAAVQTARLNLGYATVTAPISGRIGRALVTEGALVSQAEATQLAVVQQISPAYVNFTQPVGELTRLRRSLASGSASAVSEAPVRIVMEDGTELRQSGRLLFSDLSVDPTSGQVTLRAEVPNPEQLLLPGMYVRARIAQSQVANGVLLPQQAVSRGDKGDSVLVVGADNKPAPRPVKLGGAQNGQWLVLEGLKAGERVIADGFQKMFVPGAPVTPVPWSASAPAAASAPSAAAAPAASAASR